MLAVPLLAAGLFYGCSAIQGLMGLNKLQFKLDNVNGFRLAGVDVSRAASRGDIGVGDVLNLTSAFAQKRLPVDFTLNVALTPGATNTIHPRSLRTMTRWASRFVRNAAVAKKIAENANSVPPQTVAIR